MQREHMKYKPLISRDKVPTGGDLDDVSAC